MKKQEYNLEEDFRSKLNEREIEPSAAAWDRLDAMLSVAEEKNPVFRINWMYVAAAFVGFLLMATVFFRQSHKTQQAPAGIAIENTVPKAAAQSPANQIEEAAPVENFDEQQVAQSVPVKTQKPSSKAVQLPIKSSDRQMLAQNQPSPVVEKQDPNQKMLSPQPQMANANELLADAELPKGPHLAVQKVNVDAASLLSQVDNELDLSFREKMLKTVSKNYKSVKVALANRNYDPK